MAGIYIHIPFCKQACHYCDFHFSTSLKHKDDLLQCIHQEIKLQKSYLENQTVETIYFGGGTPSLLSASEIDQIIDIVHQNIEVSKKPEITLEANPDDLGIEKLKEFKNTNINRLSIGVQSFFDEDLKWMNRAHLAQEAETAIKRAQDYGLENITIDLIYGYPLLSDEKWETNIKKTIEFDIPHISSYGMTVEPQTALASFIHKGKQIAMDEAQSAAQFQILMQELTQNGFEHYEISNFAKPGQYSKHNTNYWRGVHYLGIGPSAHSFNGKSRQWNIANNAKYIQELGTKKIPFTLEVLTLENKFNEYIMTSLRTQWGIDLEKIKIDYGLDYKNKLLAFADEHINDNLLALADEKLKLTTKGKLFADKIAADLFITDDEF
jgi:oxygen-independent coproporphyrinogen-3 oxidase